MQPQPEFERIALFRACHTAACSQMRVTPIGKSCRSARPWVRSDFVDATMLSEYRGSSLLSNFESPVSRRTGRSDSCGMELLGNVCPTSCLRLSRCVLPLSESIPPKLESHRRRGSLSQKYPRLLSASFCWLELGSFDVHCPLGTACLNCAGVMGSIGHMPSTPGSRGKHIFVVW